MQYVLSAINNVILRVNLTYELIETEMKDKFSYAIGLGIGQNLMSMGIKDLNADDFAQAVKDVISMSPTAMSHNEARGIVNEYFEELEKKVNQANIEEGREFLAINAKKAGVVTTESGLQYQVLVKGTGKSPKATDNVRCHYAGTLINGTEFDSSYKRNQPADFPLNGVIKGWTEGLQLMQEGAKYRFFIPSDLAYGAQGAGQDIPPYATLIFDVELIKVL